MGILGNKYVQAAAVIGVAFLLWMYWKDKKAAEDMGTTTTTA